MTTTTQAISIKAGCGYWDVTYYPKGGCFKRAKESILLSDVKPSEFYNDGNPREYRASIGKMKVCVSAEVCEVKAVLVTL